MRRMVGCIVLFLLIVPSVSAASGSESIGIQTTGSVGVERADKTAKEKAELYCMQQDLDLCDGGVDHDTVIQIFCMQQNITYCSDGFDGFDERAKFMCQERGICDIERNTTDNRSVQVVGYVGPSETDRTLAYVLIAVAVFSAFLAVYYASRKHGGS